MAAAYRRWASTPKRAVLRSAESFPDMDAAVQTGNEDLDVFGKPLGALREASLQGCSKPTHLLPCAGFVDGMGRMIDNGENVHAVLGGTRDSIMFALVT